MTEQQPAEQILKAVVLIADALTRLADIAEDEDEDEECTTS